MRSIARNRTRTAHDAGTGGFLLWIAVYAAFMLVLIAYNGGTQLFGHPMLAWPSFPGIG